MVFLLAFCFVLGHFSARVLPIRCSKQAPIFTSQFGTTCDIQTETTQADPIQADPIDADPVPADPVPADPVQADPVPADLIQADPIETDPIQEDPMEMETREAETIRNRPPTDNNAFASVETPVPRMPPPPHWVHNNPPPTIASYFD